MYSVSVVVPVYNKERFVGECLESVRKQTYENLEIIVIDDGSTDSSYAICSRIAEKDPRVSLSSQQNSGHSATRNVGLRQATSDYVMFVDADDYLARDDAIELMIKKGVDEDCDVVITDLTSQLDETADYPSMLGKDMLVWLIREGYYHASMCSRLFRRSLIEQHMLYFKNLITDDEEWTPRVLISAGLVGIVPITAYNRRVLANSVTGSLSEDNYLRKAIDRVATCRELVTFYREKAIEDRCLLTHVGSIYFSALHFYAINLESESIRSTGLESIVEGSSVVSSLRLSENVFHRLFFLVTKVLGVRFAIHVAAFAMRVQNRIAPGK